MAYDIKERFKILCLETAEEYLVKKEIAYKEACIKEEERKKLVEAKGICEGCESTDYLRWEENDVYVCYDCYYESMKLSGEFYSYHGRRAEDMDGFIDIDEWFELWDKENGVV